MGIASATLVEERPRPLPSDNDAVLWADVVLAEPEGAYSVQVFITTRAPCRSVIRAAGATATW